MLKRTALVISLLSERQRLLDDAEELERQALELEQASAANPRTIEHKRTDPAPHKAL